MTTDGSEPRSCRFCGRPVRAQSGEDVDDTVFCRDGCRALQDAFGDREPHTDSDGQRETQAADAARQSRDGGQDDPTQARTFLQVAGMHGPASETYLEGVASDVAGVTDAEASYVTETVQVEFDPDRVTVDELCAALSTTGYVASPRERTTDVAGVETTTSPFGRRRDDSSLFDTLEFRYVAGVVFGTFLLLPYAVVLYPAQVSTLLGGGGPGLFVESVGDRLLVLPLFLVLTSVVLYVTGAPLLRGAYVSLRLRRPTTDLLVALTVLAAYVYSVLAIPLGRFDVYFDLTILVTVGVVSASFYEAFVKRRAADRLGDLTAAQVGEATRLDDGTTTTVDVAALQSGDRVLVAAGERVPVDGVLEEDACTVDESVVTGESLPVEKTPGDELVGGSVITSGGAVLRVTGEAASGIDELTESVWDLQSATHAVQQRGDALAGRALPVVVAGAVFAGFATAVSYGGPVAGVLAALTALLAASPWALGLATPLTVAFALDAALRHGIVVFDETIFERLRAVEVVVFDKTGTLTTGEMDVLDVDAPEAALAAAAALEQRAAHPVADAIVDAKADDSGADAALSDGGDTANSETQDGSAVSDVRTHPTGVEGVVDDARVLVGNRELFTDQEWSVPASIDERAEAARAGGRLPVVVGRDGQAEGVVVVGDDARPGWEEAVEALAARDVEVIVVTGDDDRAAGRFRGHPAVDQVFAEVSPEGKTAAVEVLTADWQVAMVGDGTNDAPALAAADLGIALGDGTALASDAADLAIVADDLTAVGTTFEIAQSARRRLHQNAWLAFAYNGLVIPLALAGVFAPVVATVVALATGGALAGNGLRSYARPRD